MAPPNLDSGRLEKMLSGLINLIFLLKKSHGWVRIWCKNQTKHGRINPSCHVSTVQSGGGRVMVWGVFFAAEHDHPLDYLLWRLPTGHTMSQSSN